MKESELPIVSVAKVEVGGAKWVAWLQKYYFRLLLLVIVVIVIGSALLLRGRVSGVESVGYPGVFLLTLLGSASILVPMPGTAAVFTGGWLLVPVYVGLIAGVGEALGELTGYMVGYGGRGFVENRRFYVWMERWMRRRGGLLLFAASSVPNPLFDVIGVAAGAVRFPIWRFLLFCWGGKTLKNVGIAYLGAFGIEWAIKFF